jgi:hypothetical protein
MPDDFQFRRAPAILRKISEINPESDIRIRILGKVIDKTDGVIVIDDGSGNAEVVIEDRNADVDDVVRVFARVLPLETGYELRAEIIQRMNALDLNLFRKIMY